MSVIRRHIVISEPKIEYKHVLQMYTEPPTGEIHLSDFELIANDRLKILRILERVNLMLNNKYTEEWLKNVLIKMRCNKLFKYIKWIKNVETDLTQRRHDHISHYLLRYYHSQTIELQIWFIEREIELFRMRFSYLSAEYVQSFLRLTKFRYLPICEEEKEEFLEKLLVSTVTLNEEEIKKTCFYKVPFVLVPELVTDQKIFINCGYAYVPSTQIVHILITQFRAILSDGLKKAKCQLPFNDDPRLMYLFHNLKVHYKPQVRKYISEDVLIDVDIEDLDVICKHSFPLCMRNLHEILCTKNHLKYYSRLQYGFFLKGVGLTLEESIRLWRSKFTKIMDEKKFRQKYLYHIKHSYGTVGGRIDTPPYSCDKILNSGVTPSQTHGCPFKHWGDETLREYLQKINFDTIEINTIIGEAKAGNHQKACTSYFGCFHPDIDVNMQISHPNEYFELSRKILQAEKKAKKKDELTICQDDLDYFRLDSEN